MRIFTAADIPGANSFGIYPDIKDQPVLADGFVRFRGEAVLALVGDAATIEALTDAELPITWNEQKPVIGIDAALASGAPIIHEAHQDNILITGRVRTGDVEAALAASEAVVGGTFETGFVEHAYIEPEAGYARRVGDRIEIFACTQTPYMDRDEVARVLGLAPDAVRIIPSAVGGGFGGKLDLSLQPLIASAAWLLDRPVRHRGKDRCRCRGASHRARLSGRFQHRRLCLLGADGGEPRSRPRQRSLCHAGGARRGPRDLHQ